MPQARHGGRGVCTVAAVGSKFACNGLEKVQMGHIQVALLMGAGSGGGRWKVGSERMAGDAVALRDGDRELSAAVRDWKWRALVILGTSVIFGEDLRKPPWEMH